MAKFMDYNPEQAYLLPPSVKDVLGPDHLCFLIRRIVTRLNLEVFRSEYGEEGGPPMLRRCWCRFGCMPTRWG